MSRGFNIDGRAATVTGRGVDVGPVETGDTITLPNGDEVTSIEPAESFESGFGNYTEQTGGGSIARTTEDATDGSYSVKFNNNTEDKALVHDEALSQSPAQAVVEAKWYRNSGTNTFPGAVFRYQDANNYYLAEHETDASEIGIFKVVNGSFSRVNRVSVSYTNDHNWGWHRHHFYEENGSAKHFMQYNDGSSWVDIGTASDSANDLTGGGGAGFGDLSGSDGIATESYYVDEMKIYI